MSHRITTQTEIKDAKLAGQALEQAGFRFREDATGITILSGNLSGVRIDLSTGLVVGDTDRNTAKEMGKLKQFYGEAKAKAEAILQGVQILKREVEGENVVLYCRATG